MPVAVELSAVLLLGFPLANVDGWRSIYSRVLVAVVAVVAILGPLLGIVSPESFLQERDSWHCPEC